jgi:hypothetical protein
MPTLTSKQNAQLGSYGATVFHLLLPLSLMTGCFVKSESPAEGDAATTGTGGLATAGSGGTTATGGADGAGVGGGGGGAGGASPACTAPTEKDLHISSPTSEADNLFNEVLPSHLDRLHRAIGRFASGEAKILKGTVDVIDHRSALVGQEDQLIDSTSALASLAQEEEFVVSSPQGMVLQLFDPASRQMLSILQTGGGDSASVWSVGPYYSGGGLTASCSNCLTNLGTVSDALNVDFTALGKYQDSEETEMRIDVGADLRVIAPAELTMDDILVVNSTSDSPLLRLQAPVLEGNTYVFQLEAKVSTSRPTDDPNCEERVEYQVEWTVNADCLLDYGLRNFVMSKASIYCPPTEG